MSDFQKYLDFALNNIDVQLDQTTPQLIDYDIYSDISRQIINARNNLKLSQKELSVRSGLTQANISKIENGSIHPTIGSLKKIADGLGMKLSFTLIEMEDLNDYD